MTYLKGKDGKFKNKATNSRFGLGTENHSYFMPLRTFTDLVCSIDYLLFSIITPKWF